MEVISRFDWSREHLTLREFMDYYGHDIPQIILVTEGFAGRDDDMHQFGRDEVYWIRGTEVQSKVLLIDSNGRCNSIPRTSPALFQVAKHNGTISEAIPLQEALRRSGHPDDRIQFNEDQAVEICDSADGTNMRSLGWMAKHDEYDQQYLVAHAMSEGEVLPQVVIIPLYVPITVRAATGLANCAEERFNKFKSEVTKIVSRFRSNPGKISSSILQFDDIPEGDYDYVKPTFRSTQESLTPAVTVKTAHTKPAAVYSTREGPYSQNTHQNRPLPSTPCAPDRSVSINNTPTTSSLAKKVVSLQQAIQARSQELRPIPAKPQRRPETKILPCAPEKYIERSSMPLDVAKYESPYELAKSDKAPVARPRNTKSPETPTGISHKPKNSPPKTLPKSWSHQPVAAITPFSGQTAEKKSKEITESLSKGIEDETKPMSSSETSEWKCLADVPLNFEDFSMAEVAHCLKLLGLEKLSTAMQRESVDGKFLVQLEEDIFVEYFDCMRFQARKLREFIKGWRPV